MAFRLDCRVVVLCHLALRETPILLGDQLMTLVVPTSRPHWLMKLGLESSQRLSRPRGAVMRRGRDGRNKLRLAFFHQLESSGLSMKVSIS